MENAFEIIPVAGLMEELDLCLAELYDLKLSHSLLKPNLIFNGGVEVDPYGLVDLEVEVIEIIPPTMHKNFPFFRACFDDIYAREKGARKLTALEVERNFELSGERWILIGGILNQANQLVPPAIIVAYYPKTNQALYTTFIKEELRDNLFTHTLFHLLN